MLLAFLLMQFAFIIVLKAQNAYLSNYNGFAYHQSFGKIIKHSTNFKPKVAGITSFYEINYANSFLKPKAWKQQHHFPELNVSLLYARYGNRSVFGDSFNALIGLNYTKQTHNWKRNFTYQFGLNYSTKSYNIVTNLQNNVIGSTINLALKLTYGFEYFVTPTLSTGLHAVLMHHSNGSAQTPNLGINVLGLGLNLKWYQSKASVSQNKKPQKEIDKTQQFGIALAYATHERIKPYNGPKYPVYGLQFFAYKRLSALWQFNYGLNFNYRSAVAQGFKNYDLYNGQRFIKSLRWYPYIGAELLYGNFGVAASVGFYPVSTNAFSTRIPTTIGANYYFKNLDDKPNNNIRISVILKNHFAVAEYISFLVGYVF